MNGGKMFLFRKFRIAILIHVGVASLIFGCNEISGPVQEPSTVNLIVSKASNSTMPDTSEFTADSVHSTLNIVKVGTVTLKVTFQTHVP
jgi:hypothetical protein